MVEEEVLVHPFPRGQSWGFAKDLRPGFQVGLEGFGRTHNQITTSSVEHVCPKVKHAPGVATEERYTGPIADASTQL